MPMQLRAFNYIIKLGIVSFLMISSFLMCS